MSPAIPAIQDLSDRERSSVRIFEPDGVTRGIGPAVKLLHSVAQRFAELSPKALNPLLEAWRHSDSSIYRRLWAAVARDAETVPRSEVRQFLMQLDDIDFWNFWTCPEFAELRAVRFASLEIADQAIIARRLRKGLPRKLLPRNLKSLDFQQAKRTFVGGGFEVAQYKEVVARLVEPVDRLRGGRVCRQGVFKRLKPGCALDFVKRGAGRGEVAEIGPHPWIAKRAVNGHGL